MSETWKRWQGWVSVVVGGLLLVAPFLFGVSGGAVAARTAYVGGVLLAIAGLWSLSNPSTRFTEW